jgi:outer membrane protein
MDHCTWQRWAPWLRLSLCCLALIAAPAHALAQTPAAPLTLAAAIDLARANYPTLKELRARAAAATEGIGVAKTAYVPRLDALWQTNRATHNNVFGQLFPQTVVSPISGPVLGTTDYDGVWGSAGGVLLSWQAVDFGLRKANVAVTRAQAAVASAQSELTELDVTAAAADAFLTVLAADHVVTAARANVERLQTFAVSVRTLVQNQLRPGADESRADAELAIAKTQLSQALQSSALARAALADAVGSAGTAFDLDAVAVAQLPAQPFAPPPASEAHPAVRAAEAAVATVQARRRALGRTYAPRVDLQGAFSGRGSGAEATGVSLHGDGAWLQVPNWAVGVTVSFPVLDFVAVNARKRVEAENEVAERARRDRALQIVTTQNVRARALMTAAAEIAQNTPIELKAATDAESRARARYASGLANVTEVADAQRLLAQAESDQAMARLGVWRALLALTQAAGDLSPFLAQIRQP